MRMFWLLLTIVAVALPAKAHDFWSNGAPVPAWTKRWCCGPSDAHRLNPGAVHIREDGYHVNGLNQTLPFSKAMPSADGSYWAFFKEEDGPDAHVSCFYAPINNE